MYTTDDHKEKVYEEIRDLMKLCDTYENEVTSISNGTMYLVEDYCTAGSIDVEERMQNKLYVNNIQIMASRIRIMADKINSTLIQPITDMTYDPSEETQIFLEEVLLRIDELTHSIKTSYNNIRLLYQYMTGRAPEAHSIESVIIPYLNFNSIIEKEDENNGEDIESDYPNTPPIDTRKIFEERLKEKMKSSEDESSDTSKASTDPVILDANTCKLDGITSEYRNLPLGCADSHSVWIISNNWEDVNDLNLLNFFNFFIFDNNTNSWVLANGFTTNIGFSSYDLTIFVNASIESGCHGRVDKIDYLPQHFQKDATIYCSDEGCYFRFIDDEEDNWRWVNVASDFVDSAFTGTKTSIKEGEDFPSDPKEGDIVNTPKASYVWLHDKWMVHDVWRN